MDLKERKELERSLEAVLFAAGDVRPGGRRCMRLQTEITGQ